MQGTPIPKQERQLVLEELSNTASKLQQDIMSFVARAATERRRFEEEETTLEELSFWYKCLVHASLAFAEGLCHNIREVLHTHLSRIDQDINSRYREAIADLSLRKPLTKLLPLAFRNLPLLFDASYTLDTGGTQYRAFQAVVKARESFTHPKTPAEIHPFELLAAMNSGLEWLLRSWKELLLACSQGLRENGDDHEPDEPRYPFRNQRLREFQSLGKEHASLRASDGLTTDLSAMIFGLMDDTARAMDIATTRKELSEPIPVSREAALRNLVRQLFTEIEGTVFIAASHLYRYSFTEEAPTKYLLIGSHEVVRDQIVATVEKFSRHFGDDATVLRDGEGWDAFCEARTLRHRLVHPKAASDLDVTSDEFGQVLATFEWWHSDVHRCLDLTNSDDKFRELLARQDAGLRSIE